MADVCQVIKDCKFCFYADDIQVYIPINKATAFEQINKLNLDLSHILEWANRNSLHLNPTKSQALMIGSTHRIKQCESLKIVITVTVATLDISDSPKNLGLRFDRYMSFDKHVDYLCRTSFLRLKMLYPIKHLFNERVRLMLVESLVLSIFNYGDCVYGPCLTQENKRRLQVAQNCCIRFVVSVPYSAHITPFIRSLNLLKLHERRFISYVLLVSKVVTSSKPVYLYDRIQFRHNSHDLNLRQNFSLTVPSHNTAKFRASFSYLSAYLCNRLGELLHTESLNTIKKYLRNAIIGEDLPGIDLKMF